MENKYREQWEKLGDSDPYWAVLTDPTKKGGKWDKDEFFKSGETEIEHVLSNLKKLGKELIFITALDFGCGTGRLSRALAKRFEKVIAVDISSSMLHEAQKANHQFENIDFIHNVSEGLAVVPSGSINFLYSNIVLQHMPANGQIHFIKEFCRVLRPGGSIVFQTPCSSNLKTWTGWLHMLVNNNVLNLVRKIKYGSEGIMEIHTLKQEKVLEILHQEDMDTIHVEIYDSAGSSFKSYRYYASKR